MDITSLVIPFPSVVGPSANVQLPIFADAYVPNHAYSVTEAISLLFSGAVTIRNVDLVEFSVT